MEPRLSAVMPTQKEMKESSFFFLFYSNPGLFVCVLLIRLIHSLFLIGAMTSVKRPRPRPTFTRSK